MAIEEESSMHVCLLGRGGGGGLWLSGAALAAVTSSYVLWGSSSCRNGSVRPGGPHGPGCCFKNSLKPVSPVCPTLLWAAPDILSSSFYPFIETKYACRKGHNNEVLCLWIDLRLKPLYWLRLLPDPCSQCMMRPYHAVNGLQVCQDHSPFLSSRQRDRVKGS